MFDALLRWKLTRRANLHEKYQTIFQTPSGNEVLLHICKVGFVFNTTHVPGDTHTSTLNEGKRALALSILKFVKKDHKDVLEMLEKQLEQQQK